MVRRLMLAAVLAMASVGALAQPIVVAGKNFTEQLLMAEMTAQLLSARGFAVEKRVNWATVPLRRAQEGGQVDLYWEYTGTALAAFHRVAEKLGPAEGYARVRSLDGPRGLVWLSPSRVDNGYALAVRRSDHDASGLRSLSDLAAAIRAGRTARLGCNAEFLQRPDGLRPLEAAYGFEFGRENILRIDTSLVYLALRDAQVDVGLVFATDGRVRAYDFVALADDRGFFPAYILAPVVRRETLERHPGLASALLELSERLDNEVMTELNAAVDLGKRSVEEVAATFLGRVGLT